MNDVVVGVDTSESSHRTAVAAAELAAAFDVNLHIVTCAHPSAAVDVGIGSDRVHIDWQSDAEGRLKELARDLPYDRITTGVESGDPAGVICDEAARLGASTIVVGNRRVQHASRLGSALPGETTANIATSATPTTEEACASNFGDHATGAEPCDTLTPFQHPGYDRPSTANRATFDPLHSHGPRHPIHDATTTRHGR